MRSVGIGVVALCVMAAGASADFIDLPVKWSQTPWGGPIALYSDHDLQVMADDFLCDSREPIVAVRWWGVYGPEDPRPTGHVSADISFHLSVENHPKSLPGSRVAFYTVMAQEEWTGQYWGTGEAASPVYRYDAWLTEPFDQWTASRQSWNLGELFIDICRPGTGNTWGWLVVVKDDPPGPILDYAAISFTGHPGPWKSIIDIPEYEGGGPYDMAFELMVPEPATLGLLGLGLVALVRRRARR